MKILAATVALTTLITLPAFAQTQAQVTDHGYDNGSYGSGSSAHAYAPGQAYAFTPGQAFAFRAQRVPRSVSPSYDVYSPSGGYVGSDPDPSVRDQLARDPSQAD